MRKRLLLAVAVLGALTYAAPALADTTIGQAGGTTTCGSGFIFFESAGTTYDVPGGTWQLKSWSTQAGASPSAQMAAVVLRPTATPGSYTVVGVSATETLTPNTLNTFPVSIPVVGGDILAAWIGGTNTTCADTSGGTVQYVFMAKPSAGDTLSGLSTTFGFPNISATLGPFASTEDSMFVCYSKWEQDGGAVFVVSQALDLLGEGWWLPSAVAGTVPGGTNLGAYHLECNPPPGKQPTGSYLGDGGDVIGAVQQGYYPVVA
jgi:hypothetical protein